MWVGWILAEASSVLAGLSDPGMVVGQSQWDARTLGNGLPLWDESSHAQRVNE